MSAQARPYTKNMSRAFAIVLSFCGTLSFGTDAQCRQAESPPVVSSSIPMMAAPSVTGRWCTGKDDGVVDVTVSAGTLRGALVESSNKRATIGKTILRHFEKAQAGWTGEIFVPRKGGYLDATLVQRGDKLHITVQTPRGEKKVSWSRC